MTLAGPRQPSSACHSQLQGFGQYYLPVGTGLKLVSNWLGQRIGLLPNTYTAFADKRITPTCIRATCLHWPLARVSARGCSHSTLLIPRQRDSCSTDHLLTLPLHAQPRVCAHGARQDPQLHHLARSEARMGSRAGLLPCALTHASLTPVCLMSSMAQHHAHGSLRSSASS